MPTPVTYVLPPNFFTGSNFTLGFPDYDAPTLPRRNDLDALEI
jgi:hypothetical protein